jgi:hypothetical protein
MASSVINLEQGLPTVESALMRLRLELSTLRRTGISTIKIIHGYGSSGTGGAIRLATRQFLSEQLKEGKIKAYCAGESFGPFENAGRSIVHLAPALRKDTDWGSRNDGVTLVVLR